MPRFKDVETLESLCMKSLGTFVNIVWSRAMEICQGDSPENSKRFQKIANEVSDTLTSYVPSPLHDRMAGEMLRAIKRLIDEETEDFRWMVDIVLSFKLEDLDFLCWPVIFRDIFQKNFMKMPGLKTLNIVRQRGDISFPIELDAFQGMTNLRFICLRYHGNDIIIKVISENCRNIKNIDVGGSKCVTDQSVDYFLNCSKLEELHLAGTSITSTGYGRLISKLENLLDISCLRSIDYLTMSGLSPDSPKKLKKFCISNMSGDTLSWLVRIFPELESLHLHDEYINNINWSELAQFKKLQSLLLRYDDINVEYLVQAIKAVGQNLRHLKLYINREMPSNILIALGNYCPNLISLIIWGHGYDGSGEATDQLNPHSFRKLEKFEWFFCGGRRNLEVILSRAVSLKYIHLDYYSNEHLWLENILAVNPMRFLEKLKVVSNVCTDINMDTVRLLLTCCPNLRELSNLKSWRAISSTELQDFKDFVKKNNFDLNIDLN